MIIKIISLSLKAGYRNYMAESLLGRLWKNRDVCKIMSFLTGNIVKHHPYLVLLGGWFIWGSHSMQYTLKSFLAGFCPRNGGRKHKFETFFFNEMIICQRQSVLTDGRYQNLPKSGSLLWNVQHEIWTQFWKKVTIYGIMASIKIEHLTWVNT